MNHGTITAYRNGCRCDSCREVNADYYARYRLKRDAEQATKLAEKLPCPECSRVFRSPRGLTQHLRMTHGHEVVCGTPAGYWRGCRCEDCKAAEKVHRHEYKRRVEEEVRATDGSPETLRKCLLAFGVEPEKLREALTTRSIDETHWGAWRASGDLRKHCRCALPTEIAAEMRRSA